LYNATILFSLITWTLYLLKKYIIITIILYGKKVAGRSVDMTLSDINITGGSDSRWINDMVIEK